MSGLRRGGGNRNAQRAVVKATKEGTNVMNWLINALKQGVARVSRSVPQTELVHDAAGLKVTR